MNEEFVLLSSEDTLKFIKQAQTGDDNAKQILLDKNFPLIKSIVKRFKSKNVEYEDLYQLGCVGFLKAISRFDMSYNVKFSTYAVPMIAGEIKRFLRDDGAIKVSRAIKMLSTKINMFIDEYKKKHNKSPSINLIADKFDISEADVVFTMDSNHIPLSLFEKDDSEGDGLSLIDKLVVNDETENMIDNMILKDGLSKLDSRERKIIMLRFYRGATQTEIAKQLGVSQVQVSRLENKILEKLKNNFDL